VFEAMLDHVLDTAARRFFDLLIVLGNVDEHFSRGPFAVDGGDEVGFIDVTKRGLERFVHGAKATAVRFVGLEVLDQALVRAAHIFEEALGFGA
jgi:hypothetical protein